MNRNRCWAGLSRALAVVAATLIAVAMFVSGAVAAGTYKTLHRFRGGKDGASPYLATLILDKAGSLYGVASGGGAYGYGVAFKLTLNPDGKWKEKVLHDFTGGVDGGSPNASLTFDQAGNLYGTTLFGGSHNGGTVFELSPNQDGSWTESVLYSFAGEEGTDLQAGLIFDQAGNLYSTASGGGTYGGGTVFELTPNSDGTWTESVLYAFTGGKDGKNPIAGVTFDSAGNLYGTTWAGGNFSRCALGCGVVFRLTPNADGTWEEKVLHEFTGGEDGAVLTAGVIFDAAGNLYGTAVTGGNLSYCSGSGCGVVFELIPNPDGGWKEKVLHKFKYGDGGFPIGGVSFDQAGNLYGTTEQGGRNLNYCRNGLSSGCGVVYKLTVGADGKWKERVLHTFLDRPGARPESGVIFDSAGNLYGTTWGNGSTTFGSVFEITP